MSSSAPDAAGATPAEVAALQSAPCPARYVALREAAYSSGEQQSALNGDFDVMLGYHAELIPPVDWSQDPYDAVSWVLALHSFKWIDPLIYTNRSAGPEGLTALAHARDLVLDWMSSNPYPSGPAWPIASYDKAVGDRVPYLAYVTRRAACHGLLSDSQASLMLDSLRENAAWLAHPPRWPAGDHTMYMAYGLALLSRYLYFLPEHDDWLAVARDHFPGPVRRRSDVREGVWLANSPIYASTEIRLIHRWLADVGPNRELARVNGRLRRTIGWFVLPDGRLGPWGDDPAVERPPSWVPSLAHRQLGFHLMPRSGYAIVKGRGSYLGVNSSFHLTTHKHRDDLSFELFDHGRRIVTDTGFYHYDFDAWRRFSRSAEAHSVLTVDGREFPIGAASNAYGSGILATGRGHGWYGILAANPLVRWQGVLHKRLFLYRPGAALLVIDIVRSRGRHTYRRYFQLGPALNAKRAHRGLRLVDGPFRGFLRSPGHHTRLHTVRGRLGPPAGWRFPRFRTKVPRTTATYVSRARRASYLAEFGLRGGETLRAHLAHARGRTARIGLTGHGKRSLLVRRHGRHLVIGRRARRG